MAAVVGAATFVGAASTEAAPRPGRTATAASASVSGSFRPVLTSQWAGYFETPGHVTSAKATWIAPKLSCTGAQTLSSTWVGVGGLSGGSLLQAGLFDNCLDGTPENGAFAEEYPGSTISFNLRIRSGDTITAFVEKGPSGWYARVTDATTGQSGVSRAPDYRGGGSAEWMAEAYGSSRGVPVSNFGSERLSMFSVDHAPARISSAGVYEMPHISASNPSTGVFRLRYH
ncbi:MAG: G1 family glutamic endopeptidase [Acidimicrobiales bacterium]